MDEAARRRLESAAVDGIAPVADAATRVLAAGTDVRVVLVEGPSDRVALESLAQRRGRRLDAEGVVVVPMGGATNIGHFLDLFGPAGLCLETVGLCDEREGDSVRRGLVRAGIAVGRERASMETLGFYACVADLEDELIRALGPEVMEDVIAAAGELASFRLFQQQPAQRDRRVDEQLRRFVGTRSGRKARYARLLVAALDLADVPRPLDGVLAHV